MADPGGAPRVYAVGDIHGRLDLLLDMRRRIEADLAARPVADALAVFLGDYVDRGPHSRGVIDFLVNEPIAGTGRVCLKGNHEALMLAFLTGADDGAVWASNGGLATMASYGVEVPDPSHTQMMAARDRLAAAMPPAHRRFLEGLQLYVEFGGCLYVHAGVRPGVALEDQREHDLLWIRGEFHRAAAPIGGYVVHGHTPVDEPLILPHRADIDTGAWFTGRLTCLVVEGDDKRLL